MQLANSQARYGIVPQTIHWLTALFVVMAWLLGQFGDDLPEGAARARGLFTHMTLGLWVIALLLVRVAWRWCASPGAGAIRRRRRSRPGSDRACKI